MALTGLAIAAGLALAKDQMIDQPAAKRKRKLSAEMTRLSPWTGVRGENVEDPNTLGNMMTWGAMGAQAGAGVKQANADSALRQSMADRLSQGGSLTGQTSAWGKGANALGGTDMANELGSRFGSGSEPSWWFGSQPRRGFGY